MAVKFDRSKGWVPGEGLIKTPIIREDTAMMMVQLLRAWDIVTFNPDGEIVAKAIAGTPVGTYEVSYWVDGDHIRISPIGQEELCVWSGDAKRLSAIDQIRDFVVKMIKETL
jgi:hypothetical protein